MPRTVPYFLVLVLIKVEQNQFVGNDGASYCQKEATRDTKITFSSKANARSGDFVKEAFNLFLKKIIEGTRRKVQFKRRFTYFDYRKQILKEFLKKT